MNAASDLKDTVEFSRAYLAEAERDGRFTGHTWPASTDSGSGAKQGWEGVVPISGVAFGAWDGWAGRGIPELASPLAD